MGQGATRGTRRRMVQLQVDRRRQVHVAQGDFGQDIRIQISRTGRHVRRCRDQKEVILRIHRRQEAVPAHRLRQVRQCQREHPRYRSPDRVALCDAQQLHSGQVLYQADTRLPDAGYGGVAPFAMQLRPGVRKRHPGRPGASQRQQPRHLRQCRADHEALHRAQFQRQHGRQPLRARARRRPRRSGGWTSSGWKTSPNSRTKPT